MKLDLPLSPDLDDIEQRLFGVSDALIDAVERGETSTAIGDAVRRSREWVEHMAAPVDLSEPMAHDPDADSSPVPPYIGSLIKRRAAAMDAGVAWAGAPPEAGQIVEVCEIVTPIPGQLDWVMQVPLYVLLDAPAEAKSIWHGWLVSAETDYAGWWDFVLQEEDAPFDPEAGMVQLWNPVQLFQPMSGRVVARLSPARLQAVRAMAGEYVTGDSPKDIRVWVGRVAVRETLGGLNVVTGSPLGGDSDPRRRYQHLYFHAAEAVREPARLAMAVLGQMPSQTRSLLQRLRDAAAVLGENLVLVPRMAVAMSSDAAEEDLVWEGVVRIRVLAADEAGAGHVEIAAITSMEVVAETRRGDLVEEKVTVRIGSPAKLAWGAQTTAICIMAADGRKLELPLHAQAGL
jgi:hypothetical protein